jgi:hypothetical protein
MQIFSSFQDLFTANAAVYSPRQFDGRTRIPLDSSNLKSVIYDADRNILTVEFHSGHAYTYSNVSEGEVKDLLDADSHGQWFYYEIRTEKPYRRIY